MAAVPFIEDVPDYRIVRGRMHISTQDWSCCFDLDTFEKGMARASRVIGEYRAKSAKVIPMRKASRKH